MGTALLRAEEPADTPPPPGGHHERRVEMRGDLEKMAKELNLTAEQKTQIEAIRKQTHESMKAIRNDASLTDDQKRDKAGELRKTGMQQEWAILTPEQQAKAKAMRGKRGHRGSEDAPPPPPPPGEDAPPPPPPPAK